MPNKNSQIHIQVETNLKSKLEKKAKEKNISLSEHCRRNLGEDPQLDKIEMKINTIFDDNKKILEMLSKKK